MSYQIVLLTIDSCENKLGMEDGRIADSQITSSGYHHHQFLYHGPTNARLNRNAEPGTVGAWQAKTNDKNQWIQVAFRRKSVNVTGVMIQGRGAGWPHYVTKFKVSYSDDSVNWNYVQTADNQGDKV